MYLSIVVIVYSGTLFELIYGSVRDAAWFAVPCKRYVKTIVLNLKGVVYDPISKLLILYTTI